jgi:sugar O-acyltransferase (sialic acid O-acetyltransferase NeuD family)
MSKHKTLVIIGAGGHGRVVADCAEQLAQYTEILFLDDCVTQRQKSAHWTIAGPISHWEAYGNKADFIVALGDNLLRARIQQQLQTANISMANLVHPSASVSPHSQLGEGIVIFANAVVNIGARIENGSIINTNATVDHDCHIGEFCHVSPGVSIAGGVRVEKMSWLGIGCSVIECLTIAENCQIGAGAVVTDDTKSGFLYLGVPAKAVRRLK